MTDLANFRGLCEEVEAKMIEKAGKKGNLKPAELEEFFQENQEEIEKIADTFTLEDSIYIFNKVVDVVNITNSSGRSYIEPTFVYIARYIRDMKLNEKYGDSFGKIA